MHNNYYFLRQLSASLEKILAGTIISECFSQNKDELVIRFETNTVSFYIRASLGSGFSCLSFPEVFHRARKNSIDLFPGIIGYRVLGVRQFENERTFGLLLDEENILLFKMHGNRSNIIQVNKGKTNEVFRSNFPDMEMDINSIDRKIDWTFEAFINHKEKPGNLYFTFGKLVWQYLDLNGFQVVSPEEQFKRIQQVVHALENPAYYIVEQKGVPHLSLLPYPGSKALGKDPIHATNTFFFSFTQESALIREKQQAIARLRTKLVSSQNYYEKNFQKLAEIENDTNYKVWADILMANMHELKQGQEKVVLKNFYNNDEPVEIKLKKELAPQHNAAIFYRKAKNQHIETDRIQQALQGKEREIEELKKRIEELDTIQDLKSLRKITGSQGIQSDKEKQPESLPYHEFIHNGFRIWVGRNAEDNDTLTLKLGYKEDLWLHAKDVTGSHVLIKYQSGKKFPKDVIERAAQLAAYNSKRKTETLCPVVVTPKKYVRKRKGDPAGAVVVEREEVILVEPKL